MNENLIRIIVDILVIVVILLGILWKIVTSKKNNPGTVDLEMIPGHAEECGLRGTEITKLTTSYEFVVKQISGINKNLANLWDYVRKNGTGG
ncbi:hypothetical protein LCGC14_0460980 [marine sediment metagenome]|uniref:Uncharacterized protein n=1 Tax=marine sediment metagenome TaxID=412755 RepID=A0A0F9V1X4_9ZZZZ|nr:hypothetical protein [bacterium]